MKNFTYKICLFIFALPVIAGCVNINKKTTATPPSFNAEQTLAADLKQVRQSADYLLQPGDLVEIKVYKEENMDRTLRISSNGTVTVPLVGNIKIAGLTVAAAENNLSSALKKYILLPQVSIFIKEYGNKTIYVLGQVVKPSAIQIPPERPLTVLEAITSAGGFTEIAAQSKVRVLRDNGGKHEAIDIDVSQITKMGNKSLDIALAPGDVVLVPQSMF